jgi:hypothetical protein
MQSMFSACHCDLQYCLYLRYLRDYAYVSFVCRCMRQCHAYRDCCMRDVGQSLVADHASPAAGHRMQHDVSQVPTLDAKRSVVKRDDWRIIEAVLLALLPAISSPS